MNTVAHTAQVSGVQNRKNVTISCILILNIELEKGERKTVMETFIIQSSLQPIPMKTVMAIQAGVANAFDSIVIQDREISSSSPMMLTGAEL
jgi:hypothetical protein